MKKGFTLVEMLISIALMAIIGTVIVALLSTVLRSSNNTTLAGNIRQSGNYVLEQVSDTVRYATQFKVGVGTDPLDPKDSATYTTDCSTSQTSHYLALTKNNDEKVFYCDSTTNAAALPTPVPAIAFREAIDSGYSALIDTSAVNVVSCSFSCSQSTSSTPPTIGISFTLSQITSPGVTPLPENNVTLPFSNSTLMRNINF